MSKLTINSLSLQNFKGIARVHIAFNSDRTDINAKNGSGKTSLMYGWMWVLGMDVPDVIPTIDNKEKHNLETKVTAIVSNDGFEYKLCRTQTEKWKTNRATGIEEKYSNECTYAIDDVEFTLKNYKEKLSALFGFAYDKLEMLTVKDYFNTDKPPKWTWAARRKELSELAGTDELLKGLADKSEYNLISDDLKKGFSATEIRKAKMKSLKGVSEEKDRNITLIEDKQNDIAKYGSIDFAELEALKAGYDAQITELNLSMAKAAENDVKAQTAAKINTLITERTNLEFADRNELTRLKNRADGFGVKISSLSRRAEEIKSNRVDIASIQSKIEQKRATRWSGATVCPSCGQALPPERIETTKRQFEEALNAEIKELQERAEKGIKTNLDIEAELFELRKQYTEFESEQAIAIAELDNFEHNPRIAALDGEIDALRAQIAETVVNTDETIKTKLVELRARASEIDSRLAYKNILADMKIRVEQLKAANRELTDKEMILKTALQQTDAYVSETVSLVTDTINALFDNNVAFALFSENYAGAESELKETCICMYNGKTYSAMSTGEKFLANFEVTTALQKAYGVNLPLFCDNAECFTEDLPKTDRQIIMLNAVPNAKIENCIYLQK